MNSKFISLVCKENIEEKELSSFIQTLFLCITPESYMCRHFTNGKFKKYSRNKVVEAIHAEIEKKHEGITLMWSWGNGTLVIGCTKGARLIKMVFSIDDEVFLEQHSLIEKFILHETVLAYEMDANDHRIQNEKQIDNMVALGENPNEYPKKKGFFDMEIDVEKNPGYVFRTNNYKLGAFYRMWFGKESYEFLDKEALRSFPCYENVVLDNDVTRITLYENILDYKKKENREKQWEFRRALHIDEIAHRLLEEEKEEQRRNADPELNILQGHFEHGGIRVFQTFLKDGKNVRRSQADSVEEVEYDAEGRVVFRIIRKL